jgi:Fe-S oxidoreductase
MKNEMMAYYEAEREKIIKECIGCGLCIDACQVVKNDDFSTDYKNLQEKVIAFLKEPFEDDDLYFKGSSCMACFKCTDHVCPKELNPVVINEIIKWDYKTKGFITPKYINPTSKNSRQRVLASIQVDKEKYAKISTKVIHKDADILFFPGCNVYYQPDKLLAAFDVLDATGEKYSFLPGLDNCCGNTSMLVGDVEEAEKSYRSLIDEVNQIHPKTVIFWCTSCICRMEGILSEYEDINFEMITVSQFLTRNIDKLNFVNDYNKKIAIHDPCKIVYRNLDAVGPREVLKKINGVELVEKYASRQDVKCCGISSPLIENECMKMLQNEFLADSIETGADIILDICHTCHNLFLNIINQNDIETYNYITVIANALGFESHDLLRELKQISDINELMTRVDLYIKDSPFTKEQIEKEIRSFFPLIKL